MVKMQNGWEANPNQEAGSKVPQMSSPTSPSTTRDSALRSTLSPHTASAESLQSRTSDLFAVTGFTKPFQSSAPATRPGSAYALGDSNPNQPLKNAPNNVQQSNGPSLAPAPELVPSRKNRRSHTTRAPPLASSRGTPHSHLTTTTTPTQQEQDAVDTLLFLSSPANSARFNSQAKTPYGLAPPPSPPKHSETRFSPPYGGRDMSSGAKFGPPGTLKSERDIDQLLEEMREYSSAASADNGSTQSSGSDDAALNHSAPPQNHETLGRVYVPRARPSYSKGNSQDA